LIDSHYKV